MVVGSNPARVAIKNPIDEEGGGKPLHKVPIPRRTSGPVAGFA